MFGRRGYGYPAMPSVLDNALAVDAEVEAMEDFAEGDFVGGMLEMQAARDFSRGDTFGGFTDEGAADFF